MARTAATYAGLFVLACVASACASSPERIGAAAATMGFRRMEVPAGDFKLTLFVKGDPEASPTRPLHVYLEGDGTPWRSRTEFADDPTPRNPVMLRLMGLDSGPALYLGRPCYHGHARDRGCSPLVWTHRRYSEAILLSLEAALKQVLNKHPATPLELFGHSGGGALALLLARRLANVKAVITLAGNLDIEAWAALHGYSPLAGSLNPADVPAGGIAEWHFFGGKDSNIPPRVFLSIAQRRTGAETGVFSQFDHNCCWQDAWPSILKRLETLR